MELRGWMHVLNSKRDFAGNCYWAFTYIDADSHKEVSGTITGGQSNLDVATSKLAEKLGAHVERVYAELKIRVFNAKVKNWPYAGCAPAAIAEFIASRL